MTVKSYPSISNLVFSGFLIWLSECRRLSRLFYHSLAIHGHRSRIHDLNYTCRYFQAEGKITAKWIEECLPQEYKRRYNNSIKSELSSLSGSEDEQQEEDGDDNDDAKKVEQIIIDTSGRSTVKEELLSLSSPHHSSGNNTSNHGTNDSMQLDNHQT
jgi:hypothetical protein